MLLRWSILEKQQKNPRYYKEKRQFLFVVPSKPFRRRLADLREFSLSVY